MPKAQAEVRPLEFKPEVYTSCHDCGARALPASSRWSLRTLPDVLQGTRHPSTARSNPAPDKTVGKLRHPGVDPCAVLNLGQVINSNFLFCKMRIMTLPSLHHLGGGGGIKWFI